MADQPQLTASIKVIGTFKVGPNPQPANRFQLSITNLGEPVKRPAGKGANLYLRGALGSGADALFFDDADARKCVKACQDAPGWKADWDFSAKSEGRFGLRIYTFDATLFEKNQGLMIEFSQVISKTAPGSAGLSFETDFTDAKQTLALDKQADQPGILNFYSIPAEGVRNLPGDDVELKWRTYRLNALELTQLDRADPLPCDFSGEEGSKTIAAVMAGARFRLRGYDGPKPVERTLEVSVLGKGWYDLTNVMLEGDPGYPAPRDEAETEALAQPGQPLEKGIALEPTLIVNANDRKLYAVFRHLFQGAQRPLLFETENPFGGWRFVASAVPGEDSFVPLSLASSPGVYFDDRIWLVGGSQIDPDESSNDVWCFDPRQGGTWKNWGAAQWRSRSCHAVFVFGNQIWVMGGRDEAGNALNDAWTLDVGNGNAVWKPRADTVPWRARCLFSPAVYDGKIWLYGGVKEPFSNDLYDDLYVYDGKWSKNEITGIIAGDSDSRRPIASCLQVFNRSLHLFGTFRTVRKNDRSEIIEQLAFRLSSPTTRTWTSVAADGLQDWGADTSFSYQSVNFKDRMLIARALVYGEPNKVLKVYVPG